MIAGWVDGYRVAASTELTVSIVILLVVAVLATALYIARLKPRDEADTVEGHKVYWQD